MDARIKKSVRDTDEQQLQFFLIVDAIIDAAHGTSYDQATIMADSVLARLQNEGVL